MIQSMATDIRRARLLDDLVKLFSILPIESQEHILRQVAIEADVQLRALSRPRIVVDNTRPG